MDAAIVLIGKEISRINDYLEIIKDKNDWKLQKNIISFWENQLKELKEAESLIVLNSGNAEQQTDSPPFDVPDGSIAVP